MDENKYKIVELIQREFFEELPGEERAILEEWINDSPENADFYRDIKHGSAFGERMVFFEQERKGQLNKEFEQRIGHRPSRRVMRRLVKYAAAVVVPLACVLGGIALLQETEKQGERVASSVILPGETKAVLRLEGGEVIHLNARDTGSISTKAGVRVIHSTGGVVYDPDSTGSRLAEYNVLETPRGGEYSVVLSDGTRVKLNAATSLKYPVIFDAEKREVHLSGEAYFEVTSDTSRPFYVVTEAMRVRVYGTSFNVNTRGEKVQTVLVSGKVGIRGKGSSREYELKPSELAEFNRDGSFARIARVDVAAYVGWKDGFLIFENESLERILTALALWYDVDVFYQSEELKHYSFGGYLKKYENIDVILDAISRIVGVHFEIKDKTIVVKK